MTVDSANRDFLENWIVQARKGVLEMCVLAALDREERYGYELYKILQGIPGLTVTEGTLYPLLSRLRLQGLVGARLQESAEGPARKYYSLTENGREILRLMMVQMDRLMKGVQELSETTESQR